MPDKIVDVPGVGVVSFPDNMSDEQISGQIRQHYYERLWQPSGAEGLGQLAQPFTMSWPDRLKVVANMTGVPGLLSAPRAIWDWIKAGGHNAEPSGGGIAEEPISQMVSNASAALAPAAGSAIATELPGLLREEGALQTMRPRIFARDVGPTEGNLVQPTIFGRATPPVWTGTVGPVPDLPPRAVTGIRTDLPSGRSVPSLYDRARASEAPSEPTATAAAADTQVLEDIAQSLAGKSFKRMTAEEQAGVRQIATRLNQPPAAAAPPAGPSGRVDIGQPVAPGPSLTDQVDQFLASRRPPAVAATPQVTPPAAPAPAIPENATPAQLAKFPAVDVAQWLRARSRGAAAAPTPTPAPAAAAAPAPTVPVPVEPQIVPGESVMLAGEEPAVAKNPKAAELAGKLADLMKGNGTAPAAEAEPAAKPTAAEVTGANRTAKAGRFVDALQKAGIDWKGASKIEKGYISQSQIEAGAQPRWGNIAEFLGEREPSMQTIGEIVRGLKK